VGIGGLARTRKTTLCVSSQGRLRARLRLLHDRTAGKRRDLTAGEIVGQVLVAREYLTTRGGMLTNIVFMGMGEPLLN